MLSGYSICISDRSPVTSACRFVESVAYKQWERTGQMQFAEFGTQVSLAKSLWNTAMGVIGLGQGEHSAG